MLRTAATALALVALAAWLWQAELPAGVPPVPAAAIFSHAQISSAQDYRDPGYAIGLGALVVPAVTAALVAWRFGARIARGRGAVVPAAVAVFTTALLAFGSALPFDYVLHLRAVDRGIDLRSTAGWAGDAALGTLGSSVAVAAVAVAAWAAARRLPGRPWLVAGLTVWALVAGVSVLQPVVWDPLFASTHPIAQPGVRATVAQLEASMGVHPASVTVDNAAATTTAENAFVDGVGPTERVVLDDTALRRLGPGALRALIAHELAHVKQQHTLKGVLWFGVFALPVLWLVWRLFERRARRRHSDGLLDPRMLPLIVACAIAASVLLTPVTNLLSRRYEAEADWVAVRATHDGAGMERLQRQLALADLANPSPPAWAVWIEFDHPPVMSRIAVARYAAALYAAPWPARYSSSSSSSARSSSPDASPNSGRFLIPSRVRHLE
jgi:STE24 endopeptidase